MTVKFVADNKSIFLDVPAKCLLKSLKELRKSAGLTQKKLAALVNLRADTIMCYESGVRHPSVRTLVKLAEILDYDLSESINYKLYYSHIKPESLREMFTRFGFSYTEIAKLTGYCQRTVRDCLKINFRATVQGIAAVIDVLENESRASKFRSSL